MHLQSQTKYWTELDPQLAEALDQMIQESPADDLMIRAVERIRERGPSDQSRLDSTSEFVSRAPAATRKGQIACKVQGPVQTARDRSRQRSFRWILAIASCFAFVLIWVGAQSPAWARVATDFREARAATSSSPASPSDPVPQPAIRFLLLVHVITLSAALLTLMAAWLMTQVAVFTGQSRLRSLVFKSRTVARMLALIVGLQITGIGTGMLWARASLGGAWSWDPREWFGLMTLGIVVLWYLYLPAGRPATEPMKQDLKSAVFAAIAFWLVVVDYVMAPIYAAATHSYGGSPAADIAALLAVLNLAALALLWGIRHLSERGASVKAS